jgi:hypothetical protein
MNKALFNWKVVPLSNIGPVKLGMSRDQVRSILKMKPNIVDPNVKTRKG